MTIYRRTPIHAIAFLAVVGATSCRPKESDSDTASAIARWVEAEAPVLGDLTSRYRIDNLTPTGRRIFEATLAWKQGQWEKRNTRESNDAFAKPMPRMCAGNVSQVFWMTQIESLKRYRWTAVDELVTAVENARGSRTLRFPKNEAGVIRMLNDNFRGRIPVGSMVGGCAQLDRNNVCERIDGSRHIGFIGETTLSTRNGRPVEIIMAYHNNWYRPENANGRQLEYMVSEDSLKEGFERQWMATPWLEVERGPDGLITAARTALMNPVTGEPAIDDMDPFTFNVFVSIMPELINDINAGKSYLSDGAGNELPLTSWGGIRFSARPNGREVTFDITAAGADKVVLLVDRFKGEFHTFQGSQSQFTKTFSNPGSRLVAVFGYKDGKVISKATHSFLVN